MAIRKIRREELQGYAELAGFTISDDDLGEYETLAGALMGTLEAFDGLTPPPYEVLEAKRDAGRRPAEGEDPLNAIIRWCTVKAADEGPLAGMRFGVKDNVAVAGIPLTHGSRVAADYVPVRDAVVVERILRAGGEIVAKLNLESFAWSGGGETSDFGSIRNPWDIERTAAGSSGGSGAALYYEQIDVTIGTDQGGSIRLPGAWCGALAHKPTHSLVPYVGILGIDPMFDHVGPLALTTEELAKTLAVIAGKSDEDQRQREVPVEDYVAAVEQAPDDLKGVKVGVLAEGYLAEALDAPEGTAATNAAMREFVERIAGLGADVREISIPEHRHGAAAMFVTLAEGVAHLLRTGGMGFGHDGRYDPELAMVLGKARAAWGDDLPPTLKTVLLVGTYMNERYFGSLYAKAKQLKPLLVDAYDRALAEVDVIVMPTADHAAHRVKPEARAAERVLRGWDMVSNTGAADVTGHPALSIPAAEADGPFFRVESKTPADDPSAAFVSGFRVTDHGLGYAAIEFEGAVQLFALARRTPVEGELVDVRVAFHAKRLADDAATRAIGDAFVARFCAEFDADVPILESKVHWKQPLLCEADGPIAVWRRWARQFYA